jgi:hypothetical protein
VGTAPDEIADAFAVAPAGELGTDGGGGASSRTASVPPTVLPTITATTLSAQLPRDQRAEARTSRPWATPDSVVGVVGAIGVVGVATFVRRSTVIAVEPRTFAMSPRCSSNDLGRPARLPARSATISKPRPILRCEAHA